jgi:uncharacterized protein (DUF736 family)
MPYEHKRGEGTLWKNDRKLTDKHPSMKGKLLTLDGELRRLSAWTKVGKDGEKYLSISMGDLIEEKGQIEVRPQAPDDDSDIPF